MSSSDNTLTGNSASSSSSGCGISLLSQSDGNTLTGNSASNNIEGIYLYYASNNTIHNNNFINNDRQAYVYGASVTNVFNLEKPIGGNFWDNWTSPDNDYDGFVDNPYVFVGGQDNLPWARQDGWLPIPPPPGLVSWWPGDGNALDIVNENHGELWNGATFAPGKVDQAFSFDGIDDVVYAYPGAGINDLQELTIDAWVRLDSMPEGHIQRFVTLMWDKAVLRHDGENSLGQLHLYAYR